MTYSISQPFYSDSVNVSYINDTGRAQEGLLFNVYVDGRPVVTSGYEGIIQPGQKVTVPVTSAALKQNLVKPGQTLTVQGHLSDVSSNMIVYASTLPVVIGLAALGLFLLKKKRR